MASKKVRKASFIKSKRGDKRVREDIDLSGYHDEHIYSSDDDDVQTPSFRDESDDESDEENLEVKKVRLAREYLASIEEKIDDDDDESGGSNDSNESENDDEAISRKLQRERLKRQGALERNYADKICEYFTKLQQTRTPIPSVSVDALFPLNKNARSTSELEALAWVNDGIVRHFHGGGHDLTPTCVALCGNNDEKAVSGSKDHSTILWDIETERKISMLTGRWDPTKHPKNSMGKKQISERNRTSGQVLSISCSDDGKYVAVGRKDATVSIFDIRLANENKDCCVKTFTGHKNAVTALAFRSQTHQLFTGSEDRCIRHYNLDEMLYLETLYGHQFGITDIDCHRAEIPISVASDRTARGWKISEDSHLIFRGGAKVSSADTVTVIKDNQFVTGHQDGTLSLWSTDKKRAVASVPLAHGVTGNGEIGHGIVSVNCIKGSDIVCSGSNDGYMRLWKINSNVGYGELSKGIKKESRGGTIDRIGEIPFHGFINGIAISSKAKFVLAAVGQEHKGGRWERVARAKNRISICSLQLPADSANTETADMSGLTP